MGRAGPPKLPQRCGLLMLEEAEQREGTCWPEGLKRTSAPCLGTVGQSGRGAEAGRATSKRGGQQPHWRTGSGNEPARASSGQHFMRGEAAGKGT